MINPMSFLWRQFNGPQVTAFCQALWQYFKDTYDSILDYYNKLSIETANNSHITFIAMLQGLARPLTEIPEIKDMILGEEYNYIDDPDNPGHRIPDSQYPTEYGFSELANEQSQGARGGHFPAETAQEVSGKRYINSYIFKALLRGNASSQGVLGSLVALDDMLYELWKKDHPTVSISAYQFTFSYAKTDNVAPGDLYVDLGRLLDWNYAEELQAEIRMLGKTIYYPIPKLIPRITI